MVLEEKIAAFARLGDIINRLLNDDTIKIFRDAESENPWFIQPFVKQAFTGIRNFLKPDILQQWTERYDFRSGGNKRIGLVLAGNIPMVGFHDLLCVLLSGNQARLKVSRNDRVLMDFMISKLIETEPRFASTIKIVDQVASADAIIATGSDNSSRYFHAYYHHLPHLIRKNRVSVAILDGHETSTDLDRLSDDLFLYFGMGCRNVSKLYLPDGYHPAEILTSLTDKYGIARHRKYLNNYRYQQAVNHTMGKRFHDGGFFLLEESENLVSPISIIYYSRYSGLEELKTLRDLHGEKIQATVSQMPRLEGLVPFGKAQFPDPWDYADQVDTLEFLLGL